MSSNILIILLILIVAVLDIAAITVSAEGDRFDELNVSNDIINYGDDEWADLEDEIKRGDIYANRGSGAERSD